MDTQWCVKVSSACRGELQARSPELHRNLLSVSRLVTILNEADDCGVTCKLQELERGVFRCTVNRVEREEKWGENTALRSSSADHTGYWMIIFQASLSAVCLSVRKLVIH